MVGTLLSGCGTLDGDTEVWCKQKCLVDLDH